MYTYDIIILLRFFGSLVPLISLLISVQSFFFQEKHMMLNDITEQSRPILAGSPAQIYVQIQKKNSGELFFLYLKICYGNFKLINQGGGMKNFRDKK